MCLLCSMLSEAPLSSLSPEFSSIQALPAGAPYYAEALTNGTQWAPSSLVTYSYESALGTTDSYGLSGQAVLTPQQQVGVDTAFQLWANVANINLAKVAAGGDIHVRQAAMPTQIAGWTGNATVNGQTIAKSDVVLSSAYNQSITPATYAFMTAIHETGHALGLKHPGNYNVAGTGATGPFLSGLEDNWNSSLMSYNQGSLANMSHIPLTPMIYDIAAMQALYGANMSYNAGDTPYVFNGTPYAMTIWDGGGNDTISAQNAATRSIIDLNEGINNVSVIGETRVWIAFNAHIENAIGGNADDILLGNTDSNILLAGFGNDIASAGFGNDLLDGGEGNDILYGNQGSDTVIGSGGNDYIYGGADSDILQGGSGNDVIEGNLSMDLLQGEAGNDILYGGKDNDTLDGGAGNDILVGGLGNDIFVIAIGMGQDAVIDFIAGSDKLAISSLFGLQVQNLLAATVYGPGYAIVGLGNADSITLLGVTSPLTANDIVMT